VEGELKFTQDEHICDDMFYRTIFGPSVAHNAVMYSRSNHGLSMALRRMTGSRFPEQPGRHQALRRNQEDFIMQHQALLDHLHDIYLPYFSSFKGVDQEAAEHHSDPHDKMRARVQAWKELNETSVRFTSRTWLGESRKRKMPFVTGKMKPQEHAKPKKKTRLIGDFSVQASLLGFRLADALKTAQSSARLEWGGGLLIFVKSPDPVLFQEIFTLLENPPGRFVFVYFSDDSVLSYRTSGGVLFHNLDISSCDSSHTPHLFQALRYIMPRSLSRDAQRVIDQCAAPIRLRSRTSRESVLLQPHGPKLYSGSTLTTAINNLANILIMVAISELDEITPAGIIQAAERAGYVITGEQPLEKFQDLQFLKHSPVWTPRGWMAAINFGVFLRASGTCRGDLPGRGPLEERGKRFQRALVHGIYSRTVVPAIQKLTDADTPLDDLHLRAVLKQHRHVVTADLPLSTTDSEYFKRYNFDFSDFADLNIFVKTRFSHHSNFPFISKVLKKDYQLDTRLEPSFKCQRFQTTRARRA
jgi:hypothetical protein